MNGKTVVKQHDEIPNSSNENYVKCMETVGRILKAAMKRLFIYSISPRS